ncbi:MAG: cupin domain-containing protein [Thermodesulfobacteriota bacterium]
MGNFYERWSRIADDLKEQGSKAKKAIHEEELEWFRTKQDYRTALLCSRENGFLTVGDIMLGEIPPKCNTGKHYHGEEAIYIIRGKGCSVIDGVRYDWEDDSCLFVPFGVSHQHFNLGDETARYFSVMAVALEEFVNLAKVFQLEDASETHLHALDDVLRAPSDIHPELGRIIMRAKDAPAMRSDEMGEVWAKQKDEYSRTVAQEMRTPGAKGSGSKYVRLMRWDDSGFKAKEVEITGVIHHAAGTVSMKHAHMEAILYCLGGEGYAVVDGERVEWKRGTLLHIPGPQTVHQIFNTGSVEDRFIRVNFGVRSKIFQPIAKRMYPYLYYEFAGELKSTD